MTTTTRITVTDRLAMLSPEQFRRLRERLSITDAQIRPLLTARPRTSLPPLSFAQERLWFLDRMELGAAYNVPLALRLEGALDAAALERAIAAMLHRHESLRTRFEYRDGQAVQVIEAAAAFGLPVEDLGALAEPERWPRVQELMRAEATHRFDLTRGPLFRALLVRLAAHDHVLLVTQHHAVTDGWSLGILVRELGDLYTAYVSGADSPLPELEIQYADYALWQREWLRGEVLERQLGYWRGQLADLQTLQLPTDRPRPHVATFAGGTVPFGLS